MVMTQFERTLAALEAEAKGNRRSGRGFSQAALKRMVARADASRVGTYSPDDEVDVLAEVVEQS